MKPDLEATDVRPVTRFAETAAAAEVPGVVALAARGDDVTVEVHGEVRRDTQFRIASIAKPVVAAAAGMLLDEGALALDEPVDRLLPELADRRVLRAPDAELDDTVPADRPLTVRDVLTYTTGYGMTSEMFGSTTRRASSSGSWSPAPRGRRCPSSCRPGSSTRSG